MGVADGVYMWKEQGIDSGQMSRSLMETAQHMVQAGCEDVLKGEGRRGGGAARRGRGRRDPAACCTAKTERGLFKLRPLISSLHPPPPRLENSTPNKPRSHPSPPSSGAPRAERGRHGQQHGGDPHDQHLLRPLAGRHPRRQRDIRHRAAGGQHAAGGQVQDAAAGARVWAAVPAGALSARKGGGGGGDVSREGVDGRLVCVGELPRCRRRRAKGLHNSNTPQPPPTWLHTANHDTTTNNNNTTTTAAAPHRTPTWPPWWSRRAT